MNKNGKLPKGVKVRNFSKEHMDFQEWKKWIIKALWDACDLDLTLCGDLMLRDLYEEWGTVEEACYKALMSTGTCTPEEAAEVLKMENPL